MKVLVVDDDAELGRLVCKALNEEGHQSQRVCSVEAAASLASFGPHVVVLAWPRDGALPGSLRGSLGREKQSALLVTTSDRRISTMRAIYDAGADDLLKKPFAVAELSLRVRALGRRSAHLREVPLRVGRIEVDPEARSIAVDGTPVRLTQREYLLLKHLAAQAGRVVSRAELSRAVWGPSAPTSNVVVAHASHLRNKLGRAGGQLRAVRGAGYLLVDEAS